MKLSKEQLKQIIKEELEQIVSENQDEQAKEKEKRDTPEQFNQRVNRAIINFINKNIIYIADELFRDSEGRPTLNTWITLNDNPKFADVFKASPKIEAKAKRELRGRVHYLMEKKLKFHSKDLTGEQMQKILNIQAEKALVFLNTKKLPKPKSTDLDDGGEYLEPIMENEEVSDEIKSYIKEYAAKYDLDLETPMAGYPPKPMAKRWTRTMDFVQGLKDRGASWPKNGYVDYITNIFMQMNQIEEALGLEEGHEGGLKLTKEQLTKIVAEEIEKAKDRLITRALDVEKKGHKGSEMSAEKQAEFKSWASRQSEETLRDYINDHK